MSEMIEKGCLVCGKEFYVPKNQQWKFLCQEHAKEIYFPLRKIYSYNTILNLVKLAVLFDDFNILRNGSPLVQSQKQCDPLRTLVGTAMWQKVKELQKM